MPLMSSHAAVASIIEPVPLVTLFLAVDWVVLEIDDRTHRFLSRYSLSTMGPINCGESKRYKAYPVIALKVLCIREWG
jgi:hypothetical protein